MVASGLTTEADRWARPGTKLRRVYDRLADGRWHTGSELHSAFGVYGWAWDGCIAQLRLKLRREGGDVRSEPIKGRDEFRYRMVLPRQAALEPRLARSEAEIERRQQVVRGGLDKTERNRGAEGMTASGRGSRTLPSRDSRPSPTFGPRKREAQQLELTEAGR